LARIFIIGDNLLIRTLLREILSNAGHQVIGEAPNGSEAMSRVLDQRPKLVILDVVLLRRSGLATLEHLLNLDPALVLVVCSALLEPRNVISALHLGAKGFILKPFDGQAVLHSVHDALSHADGDESAVELPVATPPPPSLGAEEQRDFVRLDVALPVVLQAEDGTRLDTVTIDVSGGGILVAAGSLAPGASVEFRLDLCLGEAPIAGRARVVRIIDDGRSALAFEQVSIADHERLIDYITNPERTALLKGPSRVGPDG
jgi:two-component system, chemotaxis family, chemotaxis protein CheY